jgi:hypothetical protein
MPRNGTNINYFQKIYELFFINATSYMNTLTFEYKPTLSKFLLGNVMLMSGIIQTFLYNKSLALTNIDRKTNWRTTCEEQIQPI